MRNQKDKVLGAPNGKLRAASRCLHDQRGPDPSRNIQLAGKEHGGKYARSGAGSSSSAARKELVESEVDPAVDAIVITEMGELQTKVNQFIDVSHSQDLGFVLLSDRVEIATFKVPETPANRGSKFVNGILVATEREA